MEFPFSVNDVFQSKVTKIKCNLLPEGFTGDVRSSWNCASRVSDVIDAMGLASARAQGLQKAITTSERLKAFDHTVYLLVNSEGNRGTGAVIGLLKVGRKKLFVFDVAGQHHEMEPLCVLDFYIHESVQRMGCGKNLYEYMLQEEKIKPEHLAIDRPSEKFLAFLRKHYNLSKVIPQANNFVIFEEFFRNHPGVSVLQHGNNLLDKSRRWYGSVDSLYSLSWISTPMRFADHKPSSSVAKLLHPVADLGYHSRDAGYQPLMKASTNGNLPANAQRTEKAMSCPSTVIVESKAAGMNQPKQKSETKFHHTPLW